MKIICIITGIFYICLGLFTFGMFAHVYFEGIMEALFEGIRIYKIPASMLGATLSIIGGIQAIRVKVNAIVLLISSLIVYIVGAIYDMYIGHGIYFYTHMSDVFYSTLLLRVTTLILVSYLILKLQPVKSK